MIILKCIKNILLLRDKKNFAHALKMDIPFIPFVNGSEIKKRDRKQLVRF